MALRIKLLIMLSLLLGMLVFLVLNVDEQSKSFEAEQQKIFNLKESDLKRLRIIGNLGSFDINKVDTLEVRNPVLQRVNWVLREPLYAPVDNQKMGELVSLLDGIKGKKIESVDTSLKSLQGYGLEPPAIIVILDYQDDTSERFFIGTLNEVSRNVFVRKNKDPYLFLLDGGIVSELQGALSKIRSEEVLNFDTSIVNSISVVKDDHYYLLHRDCKSPSEWLITGDGLMMKGDKNFIDNELNELSALRVKRIFDNPSDIFELSGLANPVLIFKLAFLDPEKNIPCDLEEDFLNNENVLVFQVGKGIGLDGNSSNIKVNPSYFLKINGENIIYEIGDSFFNDWLQSEQHFRSKKPFSRLNVDNIKRYELILPSITCAKLEDYEETKELKDLVSSVKNFEFDFYLASENEILFDKFNGMKFVLSEDDNCSFGLEIFGKLGSSKGTDNLQVDNEAGYVARVFVCNEVSGLATVSSQMLKSLEMSADKVCKKY